MRVKASGWALVALLGAGSCHAQGVADPAIATRLLAAGCAGCHGTDGRSEPGGVALAGLDEAYIVAQMKAFRTGERASTVMQQVARGYGDADVAALARHFSAQRR